MVVVGAGVVVVGVVATGAHDSDSDRIGSFTGNDNDDNGVPGGTSIVNGIEIPPSNVTVTTHSWADALCTGTAAKPATTAPAAAIAPISLRLFNTVANLLPKRKSAALQASAARTLYDRCGRLQRGSVGGGYSRDSGRCTGGRSGGTGTGPNREGRVEPYIGAGRERL